MLAQNNLGVMLRQQERHGEAAHLGAEATLGSRRLLGQEHPQTKDAAYNLRETLREQSAAAVERFQEGDFAGALSEFEEVFALMAEVFGEDDPETRVIRANVAEVGSAFRDARSSS